MTELKTLKDLEDWETHIGPQGNEWQTRKTPWQLKAELKAEAVEWIKEFQKERTDAISEMFDNVDKFGIYPTSEFFNRIDKFWLEKFNLKEEDLEDNKKRI
jgi:hypothetical protein